MVDIQSAAAALNAQLAASASTSASASNLTAVPATVTNVAPALANLDHSIQLTATPTALSANNELTLITALGNITVTLTLQQITAAERQILLQQLLNITESQKPITLSLQAGSPPTQAVLLVPNISNPTNLQNVPALAPLPNLPVPPIAVGETLSAVVLSSSAQQSSPPILTEAQSPLLPNALNISFPPVSAPPTSVNFAPALAETMAPVISQSTSFNATATLSPVSVPAAPPGTPVSISLPNPQMTVEIQTAPTLTAQTIFVQLPAQPISLPAAISALQTNVLSLSQTSASLAALLQPGNEVILRVESVALPPAPNAAPSPLPALAPNQIVATVSGVGTDGQLILKAGDATLFVKTPVTAPVGSNIVLTVEATKAEPLLVLPQNTPANFSALPQAVAALAQSDPQMLAQLMATRLPQPTQSLPGALLFLFSAFKQGNVGGWLGEDVTQSLLRLGKMGIVESLSRELSGSGQVAQDPVVGEWRAYPIPLYSGQQFHALTLYVHSDRDARKEQSASAASGVGKIRFLIDMRLSKLGAMQIDGFVQPKKLDMILRSEAILPEGLHNELRVSYIKALGAVGYTGALNFQVGRQHWMKMQNASARGIVT